MRLRRRAFAAAGLVVLSLVVHYQALGEWWSEDDPAVLLHAETTRPLDVFTSPAAYRALSLSSFTPLVTASFDADLAIAGMSPTFFYAHQILALSAAAVLMFLLLCRLSGPHAALAGWLTAAGFVLSPLGTYAARSLMVRHYVEGLLFSLLALLLDGVRSESKKLRMAAIAGGAVSYAIALSAKEVYGPLPLLLIWQRRARGDSWASTLAGMTPYGLVAIAYAAWRYFMLGSAGGYATSDSPVTTLIGSVSRVAEIVSLTMIPVGSLSGALACIVILACAGVAYRPLPALSFLLIAVIVAFAPLAGAAAEAQVRYAFIPIALLFGGVGMAAAISDRRTLIAVLTILAILSGFAGGKYAQQLIRGRQSQYAEGRYIWEATRDSLPLWGSSSSWYLGSLERLRRLQGRGSSPRYVLSAEGVVIGGLEPERLVSSRAGENHIRALDREGRSRLAVHRNRYSPLLDLAVTVAVEQGVMQWNIAPSDGALAYVVLPTYFHLRIPATGSRRIGGPERFRILRTAPDGRWTITPELLVPEEGGVVRWQTAGTIASAGSGRPSPR